MKNSLVRQQINPTKKQCGLDLMSSQRTRTQRGKGGEILSLFSMFTLCLTVSHSPSFASPQEDPQLASVALSAESIQELRAEVQKSLQKLTSASSSIRVSERIDRIGPSLLLKMNLGLEGKNSREQAEHFLQHYSDLWGRLEVSIDRIESRKGRDIIHLVGTIEGIPLLNQQSKLSIVDGFAQHLSNGMGALTQLVPALISIENATEIALKLTQNKGLKLLSVKRYAVSHEPGIAHEVYEVHLAKSSELKTWRILIDARDGAVIQVVDGEAK